MNATLTAYAPSSRAASAQATAKNPSLLRRIFSDKREQSLRLRALTLAASSWAALAIIAVGVGPGIPLATMAGFAAGHYVSWRRRRGGVLLSLAIGVFIVAVGIAMRTDLVASIRGDRVPVAYFLLATSAASAFDLRTRAGLYAQLVAAGIVMFFASELAFGAGFGPIAAVFGVLLMAFLAIAYLEDEFDGAKVVWFKSKLANGAFWLGAGTTLVALGVVAFFLLPWNSAQAPHAARFTIMPFSGTGDNAPTITPEQARALKERLARDAADAAQKDQSSSGGVGDGLIAHVDGDFTSIQELGSQDLSLSARVGEPLEPPPIGEADGDLVVYVRSPVASYWRGRTYDLFDPNDGEQGFGKWYATVQDQHPPGPIASRRNLSRFESSERYLQTFFAHKDLGLEVLTGYDPIAASLPRDDQYQPNITEGSIYQIVSVEPDFDSENLRNDATRWSGPEYAKIPPELRSMFNLTEEIVSNADTDFDKAAAIASYLHQLEYDETAASQLRSRTRVDDLIFGMQPGTAVDFATAMTLMARAAGLQARLATGYLPGDYNPLSGASKVTEAQHHAWSEVLFRRAGWVPFDAAPRPDLPVLADGDGAGTSGLGRLLDLRIGDRLAAGAGKAPVAIWKGLQFLAENAAVLASAVFATAVLAAAVYFMLIRLRLSSSRASDGAGYERLPGLWRAQVLDAFARAESAVARAGFRRRQKSEPFSDYAAAAAARLRAGGDHLDWLAKAVWQAAYSSSARPRRLPAEARRHLGLLRAELSTPAETA